VSLPEYPFTRTEYWLPKTEDSSEVLKNSQSPPKSEPIQSKYALEPCLDLMLQKLLGVSNQLNWEMTFDELGADSFTLIDYSLILEEELKVNIPIGTLKEFNTIAKLAQYLYG